MPSNGPLYSFSATFYKDCPSRDYVNFFGITSQGSSATIGIEGTRNGKSGFPSSLPTSASVAVTLIPAPVASYQHSFESQFITNGLGLIFNPRANYFGVAT